MSMLAGPQGTFIIAWSQTDIDGLSGAPVSALEPGATWQWCGDAVRIDGATGVLPAHPGESAESARKRAATGARRLVGRALVHDGIRTPFLDDAPDFSRTFTITDGRLSWTATLIDMAEVARPLIMFTGALPPEATALYILEGLTEPVLPAVLNGQAEGVVCFTPGTMLETPDGPKLIDDLVAGDRVVTKDNDAQNILWVGTRQVSGARLYAMPDLRPVRLRENALGTGRPTGDLIVSPDHRMLVTGPVALALWGEKEVLVAARDLINDSSVVRDMSAKSVTYIHLMLADHSILIANGVETESFHPAAAELDAINVDQRLRLFDVMPELEHDATAYGPMSRRVLNRAEAALLDAVT